MEAQARQVIHGVATRRCQIFLLLVAMLLVACATVEAPGQPEAITLGMGTTDGSCGTTLCCSNCPAIPVLRVIDGDTFVTSGNQSVRLFGVDTPERGEQCYRVAIDCSRLTTEGMMVGTVSYMPPEQAMGFRDYPADCLQG